MGNKNSHDFTTGRSRSVSFDISTAKPWGKKNHDSRAYSLANRSPDLSSRSYNAKSLGPGNRASSLGSLNTNNSLSYSQTAPSPTAAARPTSATLTRPTSATLTRPTSAALTRPPSATRPTPATAGLTRQSSSQSAVTNKPSASATLPRQTSSQPALSRQTSSQLSTPRQYSDAYLTDDLKKLYKAHDKSKAQALVEDIDPYDTSALTLDRKLNALKNQRQSDTIIEARPADGTLQRKSRNKAKAPQAPPQPGTSVVINTVTNGKIKTKKKSAPAPPKQITVEQLPPPPPLPDIVYPSPPSPPTTPAPTIGRSPVKQVFNDSNNNNNNNSGRVTAEVEVEMEATLAATTRANNPGHPLSNTSAEVVKTTSQNEIPVPVLKKRTKKAPAPVPQVEVKGSSTLELELDSADDFIKAISTKAEQKEISVQCDIPSEQNLSGDNHKEDDVIEKASEKKQEEPGDILKLYIHKNAEKDSHRPPDASSPSTEEPESAARKQNVAELDEMLVQTDEILRPVLPHKELAINLHDMDANSVTTEGSDIADVAGKEDYITPRPEIGVSDEMVPEPPIQTFVNSNEQPEVQANMEEEIDQEETIDTIKAENTEEGKLNSTEHIEPPITANEPTIDQLVHISPHQEEDFNLAPSSSTSSAQLSPYNHHIDNSEHDIPSPTQSEKLKKKVKKHRSFSKISKSVKSFMSSLGKSSNKNLKQKVTDKYGDDQEQENEPELEISNDNWVFSSKGAIKPVVRAEYNPAWVDETFSQPQSPEQPDQAYIDGQIDKLMEGAVDLSDNDQTEDEPRLTVTDGNSKTEAVEVVNHVESLPTYNVLSARTEKDDTDITSTESDTNEANGAMIEPDKRTLADKPSTETIESGSLAEESVEMNTGSDLVTNGDLNRHSSKHTEVGSANGWDGMSDSSTEMDASRATKETVEAERKPSGVEGVVVRAKLATIVSIEAEKLAKASAENSSNTVARDSSAVPEPTIQNRSSIALMTPRGYGETSSTYRRIDKSRLSNPGT